MKQRYLRVLKASPKKSIILMQDWGKMQDSVREDKKWERLLAYTVTGPVSKKVKLPGGFHLSHKVSSDFKLKKLGHPALSPMKRRSMAWIPPDPSQSYVRNTHDKNRLNNFWSAVMFR